MGKKKFLRQLKALTKSNLNLSKLDTDDVIPLSPSSHVCAVTPSQELLARTWKTSLRVGSFS